MMARFYRFFAFWCKIEVAPGAGIGLWYGDINRMLDRAGECNRGKLNVRSGRICEIGNDKIAF
jgi:hypothetical protein